VARSTSFGHRRALEAHGLAEPTLTALETYLDLVAAWSPRVNLTGAKTDDERVAVLVAPVLAAAPLLLPGRLLDVGSGNGSPGLVLSLLRPDLRPTLLEPRQKRWAFLREAARAVGRADIDVRRERHEAYPGPPAENVTLRAVRLDLPALAPLVAEAGQVLYLGGPVPSGRGFRVETRTVDGEVFHVARRE
jgi:16S rRNA (guanine527-N7)-methyltransferase